MSLWSVFSVSQQLKSNLACFSNPKVTCSHNVVVAEKLLTFTRYTIMAMELFLNDEQLTTDVIKKIFKKLHTMN
jgi:hypothetical protein